MRLFIQFYTKKRKGLEYWSKTRRSHFKGLGRPSCGSRPAPKLSKVPGKPSLTTRMSPSPSGRASVYSPHVAEKQLIIKKRSARTKQCDPINTTATLPSSKTYQPWKKKPRPGLYGPNLCQILRKKVLQVKELMKIR